MDPMGAYVGGATGGSLGGPKSGKLDAWLARYDGLGNQLWIRQTGTRAEDQGYAASADNSGEVFVTGWTWGKLAGLNAGLEDIWLARYNSAGMTLWIRQIGTIKTDYGFAAAFDGTDGVYVGGLTDGSLGGLSAGPNADGWLARYDRACRANPSYCIGRPNSAGCVPTIATIGTPSASSGIGFTIQTSSVLDNTFGLYFYSKIGPNSRPFHKGFLCAQPPLMRTAFQNSGGTPPCGGSFQMDFNAYVASGKDPALVAGQQVWIQAWSHDPGFSPPNDISLSDAISFTLCP